MRIVKCNGKTPAQMAEVPGFVYCGRAWGGFPASPLGNPYRVGKDGPLPVVLAKYRAWLYQNMTCPRTSARDQLIDILGSLTPDSVLGCWCVEKPVAGEGIEQCHCDIIANASAWYIDQASI